MIRSEVLMNFSKCLVALEEERTRKRMKYFRWCRKDLLNGKNRYK